MIDNISNILNRERGVETSNNFNWVLKASSNFNWVSENVHAFYWWETML